MRAVADGTVISRVLLLGLRQPALPRPRPGQRPQPHRRLQPRDGYRVGVGDHVTRGEVVGYVGSTGWSTGCHLHFTILQDGTAVDPMNVPVTLGFVRDKGEVALGPGSALRHLTQGAGHASTTSSPSSSRLLTALAIGAGPAAASTGGTPDGNTHPNVGLILFYQRGRPLPVQRDADLARRCCSPPRTAPTPTLGKSAGRRSALRDGRAAADRAFPVAADPAVGYTARRDRRRPATCAGTAYTHPELLRLHRPGQLERRRRHGPRPAGHRHRAGQDRASVPTLDAYRPDQRCNKTLFTAVGYGTEVRKPDSRAAEADADELPADPPVRRHAGPEADAADPADQRQRARHLRHRRHLLR